MTAREWFQAYTDAVSTAGGLMEFTVDERAEASAYWQCAMFGFRSAKGLEYADSVAVQVDALLEGVEAMRKGAVP